MYNDIYEYPMLIKRHTKRVPVWFHLYEVKKKENVLFDDRSKRSSYLCRG